MFANKFGFPEINYGPETETGVAEPAGGAPPGGEAGGQEDGFRADPLDNERGTSRRSIREELNQQFSAARKADPAEGTEDRKSGRFAPQGARKPAVGAVDTGAAAPAEPGATEGAEAAPADPAREVIKPPASLKKHELAEWDKAPDTIKKAFLRREEDTARGVEELKGRYAEFDRALEPHVEAIRRHGHTPAAAVGQLFAWFKALATNPRVAFPVLAQSFGYDINDFAQRQAAAQAAQVGAGAGGDPAPVQSPPAAQFELPPEYKQLLDGTWQKMSATEQKMAALEQQLGQFRAFQAADSEAKTKTIIDNWAKDKPHFDDVRVLMSRLIESGIVPLRDGQVDLDAAYEHAVYSSPEIRAQLQATERQKAAAAAEAKAKAERTAQQAAADRARGASRSLAPSAPGAGGAVVAGSRPKKGMSVKESLMAAIQESRA
jgi:hypothetical protein